MGRRKFRKLASSSTKNDKYEEDKLERELAEVFFEEIQKPPSNGFHALHPESKEEKKSQRLNKNRSVEISSKKPVDHGRNVLQLPNKGGSRGGHTLTGHKRGASTSTTPSAPLNFHPSLSRPLDVHIPLPATSGSPSRPTDVHIPVTPTSRSPSTPASKLVQMTLSGSRVGRPRKRGRGQGAPSTRCTSRSPSTPASKLVQMTLNGSRVGRTHKRGRGQGTPSTVTTPSTSRPSLSRPADVHASRPVDVYVPLPPSPRSPSTPASAQVHAPLALVEGTSDTPDVSPATPSGSSRPSISTPVTGPSTCGGLLVIHVEGDRLMPSNTCSRRMKKIFEKKIHPDGYLWKNVPADYKDSYFKEFKKYFKWDESIDSQVRAAFFRQASERYRDLICMYKKQRAKEKPYFVPEDTWRSWEAYWDRPDVMAKSEQQRKNRLTEVGGPGTGCSRHTGGSRSAIEHFNALRDKLHDEPDLYQFFARTHVRKDGQFVDERSKKIVEEVQSRVVSKLQAGTEPSAINMSQLYMEVVGGIKKQRVYGLGTKAASVIPSKPGTTSHVDHDAMKRQMEGEVEQRLGAIKATMESEIETRVEAQVEARLEARVDARVQAHVASLLDELRRYGVIPPTMQLPNSRSDSSPGTNGVNLGDD